MRITKIQDDGNKFLLHGETGLYEKLEEVFDQLALGVSVTRAEAAEASILYTENNRDIVLRVLRSRTEGNMEKSQEEK